MSGVEAFTNVSVGNGFVLFGFRRFDYLGSLYPPIIVPQTGSYFVGAVGAAGGLSKANSSDLSIATGAGVGGTVFLTAGTELNILVGGEGASGGLSGGGGGGSFVWEDSASVGSHAPIPEPSTWAMMLLGFVGLGYAGYRQTRKDQAARLTAKTPLATH